jgi:hypothetical protein
MPPTDSWPAPAPSPAAHAVARSWPVTVVTAQTALSFVLLLTPTGSLPSPGWRWWARVTVAAAIMLLVGLGVASGPLDPQYQLLGGPFDLRGQGGVLLVVNQLALAVTTLAVVVGAGSLVVRFRRATGVERQQLRWVAGAAALAVLGAVVALGGVAVGATAVVTWAISACFAVLPVALGVAILRYRLYDLDRIVSRTLAWGLLTLLLGGGYAVVVLGLGQLLGQDSSLVVAAATLALAALFQPARRRVQQAMDRRFNRRRHDAAQTIAAFSDRLHQQVDLDTLSAELLAVVDQTMQPTQAWLWLRPSQPASSPAGGPQRTRDHPDLTRQPVEAGQRAGHQQLFGSHARLRPWRSRACSSGRCSARLKQPGCFGCPSRPCTTGSMAASTGARPTSR